MKTAGLVAGIQVVASPGWASGLALQTRLKKQVIHPAGNQCLEPRGSRLALRVVVLILPVAYNKCQVAYNQCQVAA